MIAVISIATIAIAIFTSQAAITIAPATMVVAVVVHDVMRRRLNWRADCFKSFKFIICIAPCAPTKWFEGQPQPLLHSHSKLTGIKTISRIPPNQCIQNKTSMLCVRMHVWNQTHAYWVGDAIQPSHPLLPSSPPALSLSQHKGLFHWVGSLQQVAEILELQLQH